jgi:hypothetical protein
MVRRRSRWKQRRRLLLVEPDRVRDVLLHGQLSLSLWTRLELGRNVLRGDVLGRNVERRDVERDHVQRRRRPHVQRPARGFLLPWLVHQRMLVRELGGNVERRDVERRDVERRRILRLLFRIDQRVRHLRHLPGPLLLRGRMRLRLLGRLAVRAAESSVRPAARDDVFVLRRSSRSSIGIGVSLSMAGASVLGACSPASLDGSSGGGAGPSTSSVVGCYAWFNGGIVELFPDGTADHVGVQPADQGTWTSDNHGGYAITWASGFTDDVSLSGGTLSGTNLSGDAVSGVSTACPAASGPEADAGTSDASSGACDFLTCVTATVGNYQPADVVCGPNGSYPVTLQNGCGQPVLCEASTEPAIPPALGQPVAEGGSWSGTIAAGGSTGFETCSPNVETSLRCVPVAQGARCLPNAVDAGTTKPAPSCSTCLPSALPACPDPTSDPNAFGATCCPADAPYPLCDGNVGCSASPLCCSEACSCTRTCGSSSSGGTSA